MATEINILHGLVHDRITNLLAARRLFRSVYGAEWPPRRHAVEIELRALLSLARQARRTAEANTVWRLGDQTDPITLAKGYHEWQSGR